MSKFLLIAMLNFMKLATHYFVRTGKMKKKDKVHWKEKENFLNS